MIFTIKIIGPGNDPGYKMFVSWAVLEVATKVWPGNTEPKEP